MSSAKCRPFFLGLNVLTVQILALLEIYINIYYINKLSREFWWLVRSRLAGPLLLAWFNKYVLHG